MDTVSIDSHSLYSRLGSHGAPLVLDVRRDAAFDKDDRLIASALRPDAPVLDFARAASHQGPCVVYCVHGHEVSRDAAEALCAAGFDARLLEGGIEGWRAAGLPTIRRRPEWKVPGRSRWITRSRPKIDRIACPWLIRRFIDPLARFDYVPTAQVVSEGEARGAVPYDIPGATLTHRGERCSFDALLEDFELSDPALERLATIVRAADTDTLERSREAPGLLAITLGLSATIRDDHEMLAVGMRLYEALYVWCRDLVAERHGWYPEQIPT